MTGLLGRLPASTPRPPDELIGPGIAGFVAIFALALGAILLMRDMNRRVQRLRYRGPRATGSEPAEEGREPTPGEADRGAPSPRAPEEPGGGSPP